MRPARSRACAARSRVEIARRMGRPMNRACGSGVSGNEVATSRVQKRAPNRFAKPGQRVALVDDQGQLARRRATTYAGVQT